MAAEGEDRDDPVLLLKELIRCPSVTPEEAGALDTIERFLVPLGFTCTRLTFEGEGSYPVQNLFATRGTGGRHLLFGGHVDVVPPGDATQWRHAPFSGAEDGGLIWGRGAQDMKGGVAAFCAAAARAVHSGIADSGRISLAITGDEEDDAVNGTDKLMQWAEAQGQRFDFAVVGEPSSVETLGDTLKIGRRGSFDGRVIVTGKQGHVAYPHRARNPVPVAAKLVARLTDVPLDEGTGHFQPSNLEVTDIEVGNKAGNVIPGAASFRFNVRFNDLWDEAKLRAWTEARIADVDAAGCDIRFEVPGRTASSFITEPGADVAMLAGLIEARTGKAPVLSTGGGTSDARFISRYCPVVECGLVGDSMHQIDEHVPIAEVEALTALYVAFIEAFLSGSRQ